MSARFELAATPLQGLQMIQRKSIGDSRGYFERMFCIDELQTILGDRQVVQINHTQTQNRGTVRGMHFQFQPHSEMKLISCLRGEVFDVAVDLRRGSPTFLHWHAEVLSAENHKTLAIPEGFAHGFQTLSDDCEMLYLHSAAYAPDCEAGLNPHDERLAITWPLVVSEMSSRDAARPMLNLDFPGVSL